MTLSPPAVGKPPTAIDYPTAIHRGYQLHAVTMLAVLGTSESQTRCLWKDSRLRE